MRENLLSVDLQLPIGFIAPEWPRSVGFFRELVGSCSGVARYVFGGRRHESPDENWMVDGIHARGTTTAVTRRRTGSELPSRDSRATSRPWASRLSREERSPHKMMSKRPASPSSTRPLFVSSFPMTSPSGRRILRPHWWQRPGSNAYEIVGVVADVRFGGVDSAGLIQARGAWSEAAMYFPHAQQPVPTMTLMVRTERNPLDMVQAVRNEVGALEPNLPLDDVNTMDQMTIEATAPRRFNTLLLGIFAFSPSFSLRLEPMECSPIWWPNGRMRLECEWRWEPAKERFSDSCSARE